MQQTQRSQYLIGFSYETSAGCRYRQCFLLDKSWRKMYTICFQRLLFYMDLLVQKDSFTISPNQSRALVVRRELQFYNGGPVTTTGAS
jgi:hypothetical protein